MTIKYFFTLLLAAASSVATASDVADFFADLNSFSGHFSQIVEQDGQVVQQSVGNVQLKKPLKFRWDYETPEPMQLISDGEQFYHYDIDLAQATAKPIEEVSGTAIATLLNNDNNKIDETFDIRAYGAPAVERQFPDKAGVWLGKAALFYELTPKNKNDDDLQATKVILGISADKKLTVFYAEDAYGKNSFVFDNVRQNQAIADSEFVFTPPKGVDILGQ